VTVLLAGQKTGAPRPGDGNLARERQVERQDDDRNFRYRSAHCKERMDKSGRFTQHKIIVTTAATGEELLGALENASSQGQVKNFVVWTHSSQYGMFLKEDAGFYRFPSDVDTNKDDANWLTPLKARGLRFVQDLHDKIAAGTIAFAANALVMFCGCRAAGGGTIDNMSLAALVAAEAKGTGIGATWGSDQSKVSGSMEKEYTEKQWAIFVGGSGNALSATQTGTGDAHYLDVLAHLRP
jgi:hypothetical protein